MSLHFQLPPLPDSAPQVRSIRFHIPKHAWRIQHRNSGNLSSFYRCREMPHPEGKTLSEENVIQALSEARLSHIRGRPDKRGRTTDKKGNPVKRHINWKCKLPPYSPFISVSDSPVGTQKRASFFMYKAEEKKVQLMTVVKIDSEGLVPAVYKEVGEPDIFVWVSAFVKPEDGQPITEEEFYRLKGEFWFSMSQLHEDKPWGAEWWIRNKFNPDEWLIGGAIPKSRVVEVLPCIGDQIIEYDEEDPRPVIDSAGEWRYQFDRETKVWKRLPKKRNLTWCEKEWNSGGDDGAQEQQRIYDKMQGNTTWQDPYAMTQAFQKNSEESEESEDEDMMSEIDNADIVGRNALYEAEHDKAKDNESFELEEAEDLVFEEAEYSELEDVDDSEPEEVK